jgi:hypothetical protein
MGLETIGGDELLNRWSPTYTKLILGDLLCFDYLDVSIDGYDLPLYGCLISGSNDEECNFEA